MDIVKVEGINLITRIYAFYYILFLWGEDFYIYLMM